MNYRLYIIGLFLIPLMYFGCEEDWDEHYTVYPDTVNKEMWGEMQNDSRISKFLELLEENQTLDTIFDSDISYTLFIPENSVLEAYLEQIDTLDDENYLGYHIASHFIQSGNIEGTRVVQTITNKYIQFERYGETVLVDGVNVSYESPLYLDGKYFIMEDVIEPLPNLYEYFKTSNPVLKSYIDSKDSIILDKELSTPIGYTEDGRTIYDTVADVINNFEEKYFRVKHEFRENSATIVFPKVEDYNMALNIMADDLGVSANDYRDIPIKWQYDVLMPFLFEQGIFLNRLEPEEFVWKTDKDTLKLLNILGDSVQILYTPYNKTVCSNGYAYDYSNFVIPDSLYLGNLKFEPERLLVETGINRFAWNDSVIVIGENQPRPQKVYINGASNDSVLKVDFDKGRTASYSVEFKGPNLFPNRRYLMVIATHMDYGGVYDIYINDEYLTTFDYYEFARRGGLITSVTGKRYFPDGRYNKFDLYVDNITSYDENRIRFVYTGPSTVVAHNGLYIDYIEFEPVDN